MCTCSFIFLYKLYQKIGDTGPNLALGSMHSKFIATLLLFSFVQHSSPPACPQENFLKTGVNVNIEENYGLRISKTKRPGSSLDLHDIDLNNELVGGGGGGSPCLKLHVQCSLNILYTLYVLFSTLYSYILFTFTATL